MADLLLEDVARVAKLPLSGWQLRFEESLVEPKASLHVLTLLRNLQTVMNTETSQRLR